MIKKKKKNADIPTQQKRRPFVLCGTGTQELRCRSVPCSSHDRAVLRLDSGLQGGGRRQSRKLRRRQRHLLSKAGNKRSASLLRLPKKRNQDRQTAKQEEKQQSAAAQQLSDAHQTTLVHFNVAGLWVCHGELNHSKVLLVLFCSLELRRAAPSLWNASL